MKARVRGATLLAGLALAVITASILIGGGDSRAGEETSIPSQDVVVTRDNERGHSGCRPRALGERLAAFTAALRTADVVALRRFWRRRFEWFSVGGPRG